MGGGATIRIAAKAAVLGGYRTAEAALGRRTPRPPVVPAAAAAPSISAAVGESIRVVAPAPPAPWRESELDYWELAGAEEMFDAIHPSPRMVFGGVPTLQEAKEATADLKEAVDKVYFTPSPAEEPLENSQVSTTSERSVVLPEVPKHVVRAFSLLQAPDAQNVVASIASDPNVWDAIMKNESVMQFYKSQESVLSTEINDAEDGESNDSAESSAAADEETSESSPLWDLVDKIKLRVSEMVGNISDLFQEIIGTSAGATSKTTPHGTAGESFAMGASFLALAIAAILVVLLKRGA